MESKEHRKYFDQNGKEVPSCTTIIKLMAKPSLVNWANYMGFKRIDIKNFLEKKSTYGTHCHKLFEIYFTGLMTSYPMDVKYISRDEHRKIVEKFDYIRAIFNKLHIKIIAMELPLQYSRFGGTLDLLAYNEEEDKVMLFDLKTSKQVYDSHLIQLGGYSILLKETLDIDVDEVGIILLSKEIGDKNLINIYSRKSNWKNEEIFKKLLDIYYLMVVDDTKDRKENLKNE